MTNLVDFVGPDVGIWASFLVVALMIAADTILGIFASIKGKYFDWAILPQFLFTGVLPFIGGLVLLAVLAHFIAAPFVAMFYAAAGTVAAKYLADLWEKLKLLFGAVVPGE